MGSSKQSLTASLVRAVAIAMALLMVTILTVNESRAAFTAATDNGANTFSADTLTLTDDDGGSVLFSLTGMVPGTSFVECIEVTYSGSRTPVDIRMHGTTTGPLDTYLDVAIDTGTGGTFGDCTTFAPTAILYSGTLNGYASTHTDYPTGLAAFTAPTNPTVQSFRFTVSVQDDDAAQGLASTARFVFEAQS